MNPEMSRQLLASYRRRRRRGRGRERRGQEQRNGQQSS
jgi:hypothetical protein